MLARICAIADPAEVPDPAYAVGLQASLKVALDYGLGAITSHSGDPGLVPVQLLAQARLAARNGVALEAVLRRYAAGHALVSDTVVEEAAAAGIGPSKLRSAMHGLAIRYDRVIAAVSEEHAREAGSIRGGSGERRHGLVCQLLEGEPLDARELGYNLNLHHLAIVASGPNLGNALTTLVRHRIDRHILLIAPDEHSVWAWLGGRRPIDGETLELIASARWPKGSAIACGEAGEGLAGWRLSHRQAAVALPVAQHSSSTFVRYADVALLAAALRDDILAVSLRRRYLAPLEADRDGGVSAKETLSAYFAAAGNVSSAAATLGVSRSTVRNRLSAIAERLDHPIGAVGAELEVALRLDAMSHPFSRSPMAARS